MEKPVFAKRFHEAATVARDFARQFIEEPLPDRVIFRVRLNSSYDGNPLDADEVVFPADGSLARAEAVAELGADEVVDLLWRDGRVPEWVDMCVIDETGDLTVVQVMSCGRFTANDKILYHEREGRPPFHVTGPAFPVGYQEGQRYSIHYRSECWSPRDVGRLHQHAAKVWSLDLCGRQFDDEQLGQLPRLPALEILELRGVRLTGKGFGHLTQFPRLRVLRARVAETASLDFASLPRLAELTDLSVMSLPPQVAGLHRLEEATPSLERLVLGAETGPTFSGPWPRLPGLSSLSVTMPRVDPGLPSIALGLKDVVLHVPTASDADVLAIASVHPQLESLDLRGTAVTDALLGEALHWSKLRFLDVVGTRVSEAALEAFVAKRPKVKVFPRKVQVRVTEIKPK